MLSTRFVSEYLTAYTTSDVYRYNSPSFQSQFLRHSGEVPDVLEMRYVCETEASISCLFFSRYGHDMVLNPCGDGYSLLLHAESGYDSKVRENSPWSTLEIEEVIGRFLSFHPISLIASSLFRSFEEIANVLGVHLKAPYLFQLFSDVREWSGLERDLSIVNSEISRYDGFHDGLFRVDWEEEGLLDPENLSAVGKLIVEFSGAGREREFPEAICDALHGQLIRDSQEVLSAVNAICNACKNIEIPIIHQIYQRDILLLYEKIEKSEHLNSSGIYTLGRLLEQVLDDILKKDVCYFLDCLDSSKKPAAPQLFSYFAHRENQALKWMISRLERVKPNRVVEAIRLSFLRQFQGLLEQADSQSGMFCFLGRQLTSTWLSGRWDLKRIHDQFVDLGYFRPEITQMKEDFASSLSSLSPEAEVLKAHFQAGQLYNRGDQILFAVKSGETERREEMLPELDELPF